MELLIYLLAGLLFTITVRLLVREKTPIFTLLLSIAFWPIFLVICIFLFLSDIEL